MPPTSGATDARRIAFEAAVAALWADRSLSTEEAQHVNHLIEALATDADERERFRKIALAGVDQHRLFDEVGRLDPASRRRIFEQALEALKSDKLVWPREMRFLRRLRKVCGIGWWEMRRKIREAKKLERVKVRWRWPVRIAAGIAGFVVVVTLLGGGADLDFDPDGERAEIAVEVVDGPTPDTPPLDGPDVYELVRRSVVTVRVLDGFTPVASGSGSVIGTDDDGLSYVLTNRHVIAAGPGKPDWKFEVQMEDGGRYWAEVDFVSAEEDLALLAVEGIQERSLPLSLALADHLRVGDTVWALGSPVGLRHTLTEGVVSALRDQYVQTDATTYYGSSGGPLLDAHGHVCGVVTKGHRDKDFNFALRGDEVALLLEQRLDEPTEAAGD